MFMCHPISATASYVIHDNSVTQRLQQPLARLTVNVIAIHTSHRENVTYSNIGACACVTVCVKLNQIKLTIV